jgi:3-deoxy-7-phosphoheptulonate synthase
MTLAAIACGADGLLIEVHPQPDKAIKDGAQSLTPSKFSMLMDDCRSIAAAVGRSI